MIELLIVIAIIAILAALLLPVLNEARARGKLAMCMNNSRQLAICWKMYSADNSEKLVENNPGNPEFNNWVLGNMKNAAQSTNDIYLRQGLIFPYAAQTSLFHCPMDVSQNNGRLRARSISMNGWMGSRYMETYAGSQKIYRTFVKESEIAAAGSSTLWVILDELESTIDDGWFLVAMESTSTPSLSIPAVRHSQGYVLNFADSHVERYKLRDLNLRAQTFNGTADWSRLKQATTIQ